ncbi:hypothetical protein B0H17DRAFT_1176135 [Mycena rosella]|uniref:DUF6534 domain-containing protein n=1 Tax=Mycena rosella TaxID=1033263 RepID=A0AAD7GR84_MYCRO|nr:hypothetical protein B0H17DRAFT_1176135 [Mycena rosella]
MSAIPSTVGAVVAGCMISVGLSAVVGFQTFLYFQIFPSDVLKYKLLVAWIWLTDAAHTGLICAVAWEYAIVHFGNSHGAAQIPVCCYGGDHSVGKSVLRMENSQVLFCALRAWYSHLNLLTAGLIVSAVTDVLVSVARYYYLRNLKQGYTVTQEVVDAVVVFTINDGCLTCAVVLATIGCWLRMPDNLIWLGIYFTIAKLYSNSILATLNLRNWHRHRYAWPTPMGMVPISRPQGPNGLTSNSGPHTSTAASDLPTKRAQPTDINGMPSRMEVFVDHQVEYNVGDFMRGDREEDGDARSSRKSMNIS